MAIVRLAQTARHMQNWSRMLTRAHRRWLAVGALLSAGACNLNPHPDLPSDGSLSHDPNSPEISTGGTKAAGGGNDSAGNTGGTVSSPSTGGSNAPGQAEGGDSGNEGGAGNVTAGGAGGAGDGDSAGGAAP